MTLIEVTKTEVSKHSIWALGLLLGYSMVFTQFYIMYVDIIKGLNMNVLLLCVAMDLYLVIDTIKVIDKEGAEGKIIHTNKNHMYRSAIMWLITMYFALTI